MFGRRGAQCFVSDKGEVVARRELVKPMIHGADDRAHAELLVAQHFAYRFLPELNRCVWIAPCQLQIKRNKTITRITGQQDDLRAFKLAPRDEIFTAKPVPTIALRAVLEEVVREHDPRKPG